MRTSLIVSAIAVTLACAARAEAQAASAAPAAPAAAAASATAAAPAVPWTKASVGTYDITVNVDGHSEPATLVVATDSAGALTAKVVEGPRNDEHPLQVEVKGDDLVCLSPTNNGVMTLTFQRHGDAITGKAIIGMKEASISGKLRS